MKKRKNNQTDLSVIIRILSVLCAVVAVVLIGIIAVYVSGDDTDVAFVSGGDNPSQSDETTVSSQEGSTAKKEETTTPETTAQKPVFQNEVTSTTTTAPVTQTTAQSTTERKDGEKSESGRIIVNPRQENWNLVVVNSSREMPEGYVPKLDEIYDTGVYMDYRVTPHYEKMYSAAKEDGITLVPYSGYRSYDRQKRNYNNLTEKYMSQYNLSRSEAAKKAATVILPPGTSEHNLGLAMDVCNTYDSFANQKEYKWLSEHAHEYGFILRYTAEKKPITGIVAEPWHWRYVGVEYAEKIKNSGLCLEEYLDSIGVAY